MRASVLSAIIVACACNTAPPARPERHAVRPAPAAPKPAPPPAPPEPPRIFVGADDDDDRWSGTALLVRRLWEGGSGECSRPYAEKCLDPDRPTPARVTFVGAEGTCIGSVEERFPMEAIIEAGDYSAGGSMWLAPVSGCPPPERPWHRIAIEGTHPHARWVEASVVRRIPTRAAARRALRGLRDFPEATDNGYEEHDPLDIHRVEQMAIEGVPYELWVANNTPPPVECGPEPWLDLHLVESGRVILTIANYRPLGAIVVEGRTLLVLEHDYFYGIHHGHLHSYGDDRTRVLEIGAGAPRVVLDVLRPSGRIYSPFIEHC